MACRETIPIAMAFLKFKRYHGTNSVSSAEIRDLACHSTYLVLSLAWKSYSPDQRSIHGVRNYLTRRHSSRALSFLQVVFPCLSVRCGCSGLNRTRLTLTKSDCLRVLPTHPSLRAIYSTLWVPHSSCLHLHHVVQWRSVTRYDHYCRSSSNV